jgi:Coenzyme PQQ synthesis protein D (PqqD)
MFGRDDIIAANSPVTASENFAGETVVIHFDRGTYFSLRGSAGTIWSLLQAPTSIAGIVAALDGQTRLPAKDIEAPLTAFVAKLAEHDLITSSAGPAEPPVISAEGIASFVEPPDLETYSDLAELITMDPVHESDLLTGWPKAPDPKKREA